MSYYSVKLNWYESGSGLVEPVDVYDPTEKTMVLIDPVVTLTVGEAGNFEFTVPRNHVFYDKFKPYECSIAVFEEEDCIFFGRLLPPVLDVFGQKKFHAEGALAFLNDCILPPMEMGDQITVAEYIEQILDYYNQYASARPDREFIFNDLLSTDLANITIYDPQPWNYQSAKDIIVNYLYQYCGGYFYIEFTDFDELEFKWRYNLTEENGQVIQFGVNLLDLNQTGKEIYTAAIAKGGTDLDGNQVGMSYPMYTTADVTRYGLICKYLEYPSVTVVDALETYCENFLSEQQFDGYTFEASAADQHPLTPTFKKYGIGQLVELKAEELGVDVTIPITRIVYKLHTAVKEVTVGVSDARMRAISTASAKAEAQVEEMAQEMECCSEDKQSNIITGPDGNDYKLDFEVDPETGEVTVTAKKVVSKIKFTKAAFLYFIGESLDLDDFAVTAFWGDGTSRDVTSECSFSITDGYTFNRVGSTELIATWVDDSGEKRTARTPIKVSPNHGKKIIVHVRETYEGRYYTGMGYVDYPVGNYLEYTYELVKSSGTGDIYIKNELVDSWNGGTEEDPANKYLYRQVKVDTSLTANNIFVTQKLTYSYHIESESHSSGAWRTGVWDSSGVSTKSARSAGSIDGYNEQPQPTWVENVYAPGSMSGYPVAWFGYYSRSPMASNAYYAFSNITGIEVY